MTMATSSLADLARDLGDRDPGDDDPTEVHRPSLDTWHESHKPAHPNYHWDGCTEAGRKGLEHALGLCRGGQKSSEPKPSRRGSWYATPAGLRKILAKAAGLDEAVANKMDMQLTEIEKAALRAAALRLKSLVDGLVEI